MGNSLRITPLTMYQIDNTCYSGLLENLPKRPVNNRGYQDLLLVGFDIDTDVFLNNMLAELAEMQLIYTNPDFFKFAVTNWALKEKDIWQRLYDTVFYKYNPIWNKDGTIKDTGRSERDLTYTKGGTVQIQNGDVEHYYNEGSNDREITEDYRNLTEHNEGSVTVTHDIDTTETHDLEFKDYETKIQLKTETDTEKKNTGTQENEGDNDTTNGVSAYNDTGFVNRDKSENDTYNKRTDNLNEKIEETKVENGQDNFDRTDEGTIKHEGQNIDTTETDMDNIKNGIIHTDDETNDKNEYWKTNDNTSTTTNDLTDTEGGTIDNNNTRIEQGNIGVTTTQQMIEAERELVKFNVYDLIIDSFKQRFCLLCY